MFTHVKVATQVHSLHTPIAAARFHANVTATELSPAHLASATFERDSLCRFHPCVSGT